MTTGRMGIVGQPVDRVQDLAKALRVAEERGRLADRPLVVFDPQAHRGKPSRRRASSAGTNVVWPTASRAFHSSIAAVSSASSSSWGEAARSRARTKPGDPASRYPAVILIVVFALDGAASP